MLQPLDTYTDGLEIISLLRFHVLFAFVRCSLYLKHLYLLVIKYLP